MRLYAIFGNPVSHSRSPLMHNCAFMATEPRSCYTRILLQEGEQLRKTFLSLKLSGANITVPFKEDAFRQCDEIPGIAASIGAVNTIIYERGKLIGYNTDAPGFMMAIEEFLPIRNALILGAGGTAKAIAIALREEGIDVTLLNRSSERLNFFIKRGFECFDWEGFEGGDFDLIINTTSAGLKDEQLPAPKELLVKLFKHTRYAFDVIYGKTTPFMELAFAHGLVVRDGEQMLLYQGVLAFELFTQNRYDKTIIEKRMRRALTL